MSPEAGIEDLPVQPLTRGDVWLLRAMLLDNPEAAEAFAAWKAQLDLETIDYSWARMLPLLQRNLSRLEIADPLIDRLRGVRRHMWVANLKRMTLAKRAFDALARAGIPFIVLKGMALVASYLHDRSLRPMDDIDILVPYDRFGDAVAAFEAIGFTPSTVSGAYLARHVPERSDLCGWPFSGGEGDEVDLHWHALHVDRRRGADDAAWAASREVTYDGTTLRVFDAADQLLHVCSHAAQPNASLRWVADAATIATGAGPDLSWRRLIEQSAHHRVSAAMADSLSFLNAAVDVPVPPGVVQELAGNADAAERLEHRLLRRAARGPVSRRARQFLDFADFCRGPGAARASTLAGRAAAFLREQEGAGTTWWAMRSRLLVQGRSSGRGRGLGRQGTVPDGAGLPTLPSNLSATEPGAADAAFISGWLLPKRRGRATAGSEARIAWRRGDATGDLLCRIQVKPADHDPPLPTAVTVFANDTKVDHWQWPGNAPIETRLVAIPGSAHADREYLVLSFVVEAKDGAADRGSRDAPSGIIVRSVSAGTEAVTFHGPGLAALLGPGWRPPQDWGAWARKPRASVSLPLRGTIGGAVGVEILARIGTASDRHPLDLKVLCGGKAVASASASKAGRLEIGFALGPEALSRDSDLVLTIEGRPRGGQAERADPGFGIGRIRLRPLPLQAAAVISQTSQPDPGHGMPVAERMDTRHPPRSRTGLASQLRRAVARGRAAGAQTIRLRAETIGEAELSAMIAACYAELLRRRPTAAEIAHWTEVVRQSGSLTVLWTGISGSEEAQRVRDWAAGHVEVAERIAKDDLAKLVASYHGALLGRAPTAGETEDWIGLVRSRASLTALWKGITASPAMKEALDRRAANKVRLPPGEFVSAVHELVLGRGATARDIETWRKRLAAGLPREEMVQTFFREAVRQAARNRGPAPDGRPSIMIAGVRPSMNAAEWRQVRDDRLGRPAPTVRHARFATGAPDGDGPLVSILCSLYRGGAYIGRYLDNITGQTIFGRCELIIVDAASPDGEGDTIAGYAARFPQIRHVRLPYRATVYAAWNAAIGLSRGRYLTNANLDDLRRPDSIEIQAATLDSLPFADIVYQDFFYTFDDTLDFDAVAAAGVTSRLPVVTPHNLFDFNAPHNAPMWRRRLHDEIGLFDDGLRSAGDWDFWLRCAIAGKTFYKTNDPHVAYYVNPAGLSTAAGGPGAEESRAVSHRHMRRIMPAAAVEEDADFAKRLGIDGEAQAGETSRYRAVQRRLRALARDHEQALKRPEDLP